MIYMSSKSWGSLSLKEKVRIRVLAKNPSLGDVVIKKIKDNGNNIYVKSNSLGTVAWVCGMDYSERLPNSESGDSTYAVHGIKRPGFAPSCEFTKVLERDFEEINYIIRADFKGSLVVVRKIPEEKDYGHSPIIKAGICTSVDGRYIKVFGQNDSSPHNFGQFSWDNDRLLDSGLDCEFYRRR
jgi:hypothetical protein